jgi:excisionase family DNA binding protein
MPRGKPTDQINMMEGKGYITPAQLAAKLGITASAVRLWIAQKKLPAVKIGKCNYISLKAAARHVGADTAKLLGIGANDPAAE